MNLTINKNIAIKYHLNLHLTESLIESDSVAFEIIKYVTKDIRSSDKEMSLDNLKFTSKTLKYIFGDLLKDEKSKEYIIVTLKQLIADELIKVSGKSMNVTKELLTKFYTIN